MSNARAAQALGVAPAEEKPKDKPTTITGMLETYKGEIARALPRHMTPDRMLRIVLTEIRKVPKLQQCEAKSLFGAVIQAAQLGLEPGSALGHAYLLPYENRRKGIVECQLMIGYRGMIDLARRSGQIAAIYAYPVYAEDKFQYELGAHPILVHVPAESEDRGKFRGAYAVAHLLGTEIPQIEYMSEAQIESIRKRSKSKDDGPWVTDYDEMARKTAVRRLFKYLPVSIELHSTLSTIANLDNAVDLGVSQENASIIEGEAREMPDKEEPAAPKLQNEPSPDADFIGRMNQTEEALAAAAAQQQQK